MEYTGERYFPEVQGGIALEHRHRYLLACELAKGKEVLDIASGEGYGSFMLAGVANHVTGVDISSEAVEHAGKTYVRNNLEYRQGSAAKIPMPDASVDLVISFETIEHHEQHEEMLREIKRVLRPGGVLYMSSPDRVEYSDVPQYDNEYHVKELTKTEFVELIARHFSHYSISGQRVTYGSVIGSEASQSDFLSWNHSNTTASPESGLSRAVYILALASDGELPKAASSILEDALEHADAYRDEKENTARCMWEKSEIEKHLALRIQEVENCSFEIRKRDEEIVKCKEVIFDEIKKRERLEVEMRRCNESIRKLTADNKMYKDAVWERDALLNSIYTSRSWRITAPLRNANAWVQRLLAPQESPSLASRLLAKILCFPLVLCVRMDKTRATSLHSVQDALENPAPALRMLRNQRGGVKALARLAFVLGWVASKTGGVCATAKVCVAALRSGDARRYLNDYLHLDNKPLQPAAVIKVEDNGYIDALVKAHKTGHGRPAVKNVSVRVVAEGNHFFREIAQLIACGFADAGVRASVAIDAAGCECPVCEAHPEELHLIVAPHEYFYFIPEASDWPFAQGRLWLLNTEQSHTQWFAGAAANFKLADLILDMDFDLSRTLAQQGLRAEHLPLGFSPSCSLFNGLNPVETSIATKGLPRRIRDAAVLVDPLGAPLQERPLDCCFFGASVNRRTEFFAQNAALFADMQAYLRLMSMKVPLQAGVNTSLTTEATSSIIRRSKVSLNIHQSENSYFEWHRIVLQGLWQGTLVVSEPCTTALPFRPNRDYVSVDLEHMPEALEYFLTSEEGRAQAEQIRTRGYTTLTSQCLIGERLRELLDIYGAMPGVER